MSKDHQKVLDVALEAHPGLCVGMSLEEARAAGDTLALFVYNEISEIEEEEDDPYDEAIRRMRAAVRELSDVLAALVKAKIERTAT